MVGEDNGGEILGGGIWGGGGGGEESSEWPLASLTVAWSFLKSLLFKLDCYWV